ncbi:TPA: YggT family protein [Candidatus Berkelbacteria bacterium]|uniref:YggT family protein n=1 Tax=Berkelbacteria bacterium GW2011_GWE1_39_12 TaxID=1618337 RepID=A0A0G4B4S6_9BACT|nr:MAG: hypothetical protein UT28_C0001G0607 [Berkelbacteria bacterium GW2011_GWE1_39_12]HBO60999.1 YggT family protein [Candidatus Berkelbacteria bacterium]
MVYPYRNRFLVYLVDLVFSLIELLLVMRILLRLFGASPSASFVRWIFDTTSSLLRPFFGIFPTTAINHVYILELSTLFALVVYAILHYLIVELLNWFAAR